MAKRNFKSRNTWSQVFLIGLSCILLIGAIVGVFTLFKKNEEMSNTDNSVEQTYEETIEELTNSVTNLTNSNNDYKNQIESLNTTITTNEEVISHLQKSVDANNVTISSLNSEIEDNKVQISSLETEIDNLSSIISTKEETIVDLNSQIVTLNETVSTNEQTIADLRTTISTLNADIEELSSNKVENENTIASLNTQIRNLNNSISELEETNESNLATIATLNNQIALKESQIADLQNQVLENETSINELNNRIASLESSVDYYEDYIFELENENHIVGVFEFDGSVYAVCEVDDDGHVSVENPVSTDYVIFNYWTVDGVQVDLETYVLQKNTRFVADVTYKYAVNFLVDETQYETQIVGQGNDVVVPDNPVKKDYNFLGWSLDGTNIFDLSNYEILSNITFKAIFQSKYGLFDFINNDLIYSWDELLDYGFLTLEETTLNKGVNVGKLSGNLYMPSGIKTLGEECFQQCSGLNEIVLSDTIEVIDRCAFTGCKMSSIILPATLKVLSNNWMTWQGCSNLKYVNYLGTLESWLSLEIDNQNFYGSPTYFTKKLYIQGELLQGCIEIPSSIASIPACAFLNCEDVTGVVFNNCKSIEGYSFYGSGLTSLVVPSTIESIGRYAFYCPSLVSAYFYNNESGLVITSDKLPFKSTMPCVVYCEFAEVPTGWYSSWASGVSGGVKYGYTYEQYLAEIGG